MSSARRGANHLAGQSSPYLLQHLHNPVDWYPWGTQALERARQEDRPIFLSIGYAACHWCHVMERESFEDAGVAELLNDHFVPIKVDREERPDLDEIYMNAVQLMTGQGGWPLSVFLTPDLEPFFGGTYFPPEDRHGRIGFPELLRRVHEAWSRERDRVRLSAGKLTGTLREIATAPALASVSRSPGRALVARALAELTARFDPRWGGFSPAPKFPPDGALTLLLREHALHGAAPPLRMATATLDAMALGGMYDHLGGGFCRYSVDERWLVPHFEKMLYNQALLVPPYLAAWQSTGKPLYRSVVEQTLDFVRRELTDPAGGFHSSLDADSEGEEGRYYVWTPDEIQGALGPDGAASFCEAYDITHEGNFEGRSIPNRIGRGEAQSELAPLSRKLLAVRQGRVRPATDDKVLTAWTGLMITAYAHAHQVLSRAEDLESALRAAAFAESSLWHGGRLRVTYREGRAQLNAYLDDHAFLARGLIDLYEACFDSRWLDAAARVASLIVERFEDRERGGFFFTSDDHETLLARSHRAHDGALPAGAGVAAEALLRLSVHRDERSFREVALRALEAYSGAISHHPSTCVALLVAASLAEEPPVEVAIAGDLENPATRELLTVVRGVPGLRPVVQAGIAAPGKRLAVLAGKQPIGGKPAAYVCRDSACGQPITDARELDRALREGRASSGSVAGER